MVIVRNRLEKGADGDAWVDTDVDKDNVLVVSEWAVVLNSQERDVFRLTWECSSMSCMEHGGFFLFVAHLHPSFADLRW